MPMNQEVIPAGAGTFSRDLTKTKILHGLCIWIKSISPLFPGPQGEVVANDWCITLDLLSFRHIEISHHAILQIPANILSKHCTISW